MDITPSVALGPTGNVIVGPYESVDEVVEVENGDSDDHGRSGKLAILVEESHGHPTSHTRREVEHAPEDDVDELAVGWAIVAPNECNGVLQFHGGGLKSPSRRVCPPVRWTVEPWCLLCRRNVLVDRDYPVSRNERCRLRDTERRDRVLKFESKAKFGDEINDGPEQEELLLPSIIEPAPE